jgi:hypothetical protein
MPRGNDVSAFGSLGGRHIKFCPRDFGHYGPNEPLKKIHDVFVPFLVPVQSRQLGAGEPIPIALHQDGGSQSN